MAGRKTPAAPARPKRKATGAAVAGALKGHKGLTGKRTGSGIYSVAGGVRNQAGSFRWKGMPQSPRRKGPPKPPRKMYAYVRKDQAGTAAGGMIERNRVELDRQYNAAMQRAGGITTTDWRHTDAHDRLRQNWTRLYRRNTKSKQLSQYVEKNGGKMSAARVALDRRYQVSFGADPHSK